MAIRVMMMVIWCCLIRAVPATVYTVGDASGWSLSGDYTTWVDGKSFLVGDSLAFNYPSGHTVDEVSGNDYKSCTTGNAITSDTSGATSITLKTAGPHYFICGVPGHCSGGMKLAVTVGAAPAGAPPSSSTTTSPPLSATPDAPSGGSTVPSGTTTTTAQPSSASAALSPVAGVAFAVSYAVLKFLAL